MPEIQNPHPVINVSTEKVLEFGLTRAIRAAVTSGLQRAIVVRGRNHGDHRIVQKLVHGGFLCESKQS